MKTIRQIGVLYGGTSAERDVSLRSGRNVIEGLKSLGYDVIPVDPAHDLIPQNIDFAFIALHGTGGEDGTIQGILEWMKIPYTGSGVTASALAFNKRLTKIVLQHYGIPTARMTLLNEKNDIRKVQRFPQVIKPSSEGSSIGISIVQNRKELETAYTELSATYQDVFCEDYITGREITVSMVGDDIYPILELVPKNRFYDYEAKYTKGMTEFILPADLSNESRARVCSIARSSVSVIGCRGALRVDMILSEEGPYILEINTIPGMTDSSDLPAQAKAAGLTFNDLLQRMIDDAVK